MKTSLGKLFFENMDDLKNELLLIHKLKRLANRYTIICFKVLITSTLFQTDQTLLRFLSLVIISLMSLRVIGHKEKEPFDLLVFLNY